MSELTDASPGRPTSEPSIGAADQPGSASPSGGLADGAPALARPVVAVTLLTAHPGNIRRDLDLNPDFLASVKANGILVPLRVTSAADGNYRVIDGHRRLAAAVQAGLAEIPADLADERADDEPGQYLDMWVTHRHRTPLTPLEEADALFAARDAGATKARIRKSTGLKPSDVTTALAAATLSSETRASVEALPRELTLEDLAALAEFEGDPRAMEQLLNAARWHGTLDHHAERLRQERSDKAEHERLCRELSEAGVTVTAGLPQGGQLLDVLHHDEEELTPESHAGCPGRGAYFRPYDPTTPVHYCADPTTHGHTFRPGQSATGPSTSATRTGTESTGSPDRGPSEAARRQVIQGNKAWKASGEVRKRWLAAHLFPRRTAPREVAHFVAQQLLAMPDPIRSGLAGARSRSLFAEITSKTADEWVEACGTTAASRFPLLMLAPIVTAYEQAMTEGEGKNTWRTDRYSPCPRQEAGRYLAFLASLGYQLSGIEQAIVGGVPYTGDAPTGEPLSDLASDERTTYTGGPGLIGEPLAGGPSKTSDIDSGLADTTEPGLAEMSRAAA